MLTILSFLGGNAFRLIFGEIAAYFSKKQEAALEIERMRLQGELDAAQHERNQAAIRLQAELGVKTIQVQAEAALDTIETDAWASAVRGVNVMTGIKWVDAWKSSIQPLLATIAIAVIVGEVIAQGFNLTDWHREIVGGIIGIFIADRHLSRRGK